MHVIPGHDVTVGAWAGDRLGTVFHPPFVAIGFSRDGESLDGAAIFNGWNGANIDLTLYAPGCFTRGTIGFVLRYTFYQLGAQRATARTARTNKLMQCLLPRLGFKWEGIAKRYYGPERKDDAFVFALFRESAERWLTRRPLEIAADHI